MDSTPRPFKELVEDLLKKYGKPFIHLELGNEITQLAQATKDQYQAYEKSNLDDPRFLLKVYAKSSKQRKVAVAPILNLLNTLYHTISMFSQSEARICKRALKDFLREAKASDDDLKLLSCSYKAWSKQLEANMIQVRL